MDYKITNFANVTLTYESPEHVRAVMAVGGFVESPLGEVVAVAGLVLRLLLLLMLLRARFGRRGRTSGAFVFGLRVLVLTRPDAHVRPDRRRSHVSAPTDETRHRLHSASRWRKCDHFQAASWGPRADG